LNRPHSCVEVRVDLELILPLPPQQVDVALEREKSVSGGCSEAGTPLNAVDLARAEFEGFGLPLNKSTVTRMRLRPAMVTADTQDPDPRPANNGTE
jgi:hypothetical protein